MVNTIQFVIEKWVFVEFCDFWTFLTGSHPLCELPLTLPMFQSWKGKGSGTQATYDTNVDFLQSKPNTHYAAIPEYYHS